MDRRKFLKSVAITGAVAVGGKTLLKESSGMDILSQTFVNGASAAPATTAANFDLVAVLGGEPEAMFRTAIAEMGGDGKIYKKRR